MLSIYEMIANQVARKLSPKAIKAKIFALFHLCLGPFSALGAAFGYVSVLMGLAASTYNYLARKEIERLKVSAPVTPAPDGQQSLPPVGMKNVERALGEEAKATV